MSPSPKANSSKKLRSVLEATPVQISQSSPPMTGPSRRSQLAYPSYEPVLSAPGSNKSASRLSMPAGPGAIPVSHPTDEAMHHTALTARRLGQPPPVTGGAHTARRAHGGSTPMQSQRHSTPQQAAPSWHQAANCQREAASRSRSIGGDSSTISKSDLGDKENRDNCIDYFKEQRSVRESYSAREEERRSELREKDERIRELQLALNAKDSQSGRHDAQLAHVRETVRELEASLREKEELLHERQFQMHHKDAQVQELERVLREAESGCRGKDNTIALLKEEQRKQEKIMQQQIRDLQADLKRAERAAERQENAKRPEEKEFRLLRQKVEEQSKTIESLERQLRRTSSAVSLVSPGEFSRMAKNAEAKNAASVENARLLSKNADLETQAKLILKENSLLRRRLPAEVCNQISAEAAACTMAEDQAGDEVRKPA